MALKPCLDCDTLSDQSRCPAHRAARQRTRDQGRGSRQARGYDAEHDALRARALAMYAPTDPCPRCGRPLGNDQHALDLDHTDDRRSYLGLSHRRCNQAAGGRAAHR